MLNDSCAVATSATWIEQRAHMPTDTTDEADLFTVAHDLLSRAVEERKKGNLEAANKFLMAAGNLTGAKSEGDNGNTRQAPNGTQQVADLLRTGWHEVTQITEKTGIQANRIHVSIGRLKAKGGLQSESVKRYRLVEKT